MWSSVGKKNEFRLYGTQESLKRSNGVLRKGKKNFKWRKKF